MLGDDCGGFSTQTFGAKEMVNSRYLAMIEAAAFDTVQKWQPFPKPQCVEPRVEEDANNTPFSETMRMGMGVLNPGHSGGFDPG